MGDRHLLVGIDEPVVEEDVDIDLTRTQRSFAVLPLPVRSP